MTSSTLYFISFIGGLNKDLGTNSQNDVNICYIFFLYLEGPPSWHIKPHNVTLYTGQKYTLPCRTHGYPAAHHTWTKDGFIISHIDVIAGLNDLIFTAAKISHSGIYRCSASNVYGTISQSVFVKVVIGMVFVYSYAVAILFCPNIPKSTCILHKIMLYSVRLYSTLLCSCLLHITRCSTLLYSTLHVLYSTLLCSLLSTLLYSTLLYSTLLCNQVKVM